MTTEDGLTDYSYLGPDVTVTVHSEIGSLPTQLRYDAGGRLTSVTEPNGSQTTYTYDAEDRLLSVAQPLSLSRSFAYSTRGKLLSETHPESGTTTYRYDLVGRMIQKQLQGAAQPIRYTYDLHDRLLTRYSGGE